MDLSPLVARGGQSHLCGENAVHKPNGLRRMNRNRPRERLRIADAATEGSEANVSRQRPRWTGYHFAEVVVDGAVVFKRDVAGGTTAATG